LPVALEQSQGDPGVTFRDLVSVRDHSPYHQRPDPIPNFPAEQEQTGLERYFSPRLPEHDSVFNFGKEASGESTTQASPTQPAPPPDPALVAAVRAYLGGDLEGARRLLGNSRSETTIGTQEELLALLTRLQERDLDQLPTEEVGLMLTRVEQLMRVVQARAPLLMDNVCFCRRIKTYGVYDPLPIDPTTRLPTFQAGTSGQPGERACVYAELRNVLTRKVDNWHVVALDGTLEIKELSSDRTVFRTDVPATPDRSRSPRMDCYVGYEFNIPPGLPPGSYTLRIQVRDLASRQPRLAHKSLDFRVIDPATTAAR
jgi:hypothetical protein